ncbi:MAG: hypothetical protein U0Y82_16855, partial [Thermoleophilia bacterium]
MLLAVVYRLVRRADDGARLVRTVRTASRTYGDPWHRVVGRAMWLRRRGGWGLGEAAAVGLLDPDGPDVGSLGRIRRRTG